MYNSINHISGKYFILENDGRFPLSLPLDSQWQSLTSKNFNSPNGCSIYLLSGRNNLYVGSDGDGTRPSEHRSTLKTNCHCNHYMQRVHNKYGLEVFYYYPLIEIPPEYIEYRNEIENSYIKLFNTFHDGYNLMQFADTPTLDRPMKEETKQKISQVLKGRHLNPETEFKKGRATHNKNKRMDTNTKEKLKHTFFKSGHETWNRGLKAENNEKIKSSVEIAANSTRGKPSKRARKVRCIENNTIYNSASEAAEVLGVSQSFISIVCSSKHKTVKGVHLEFVDSDNKNYRIKRVKCLETGIIYESLRKAAKSINLSRSSLVKACGKQDRTFGGFHWEYAD